MVNYIIGMRDASDVNLENKFTVLEHVGYLRVFQIFVHQRNERVNLAEVTGVGGTIAEHVSGPLRGQRRGGVTVGG